MNRYFLTILLIITTFSINSEELEVNVDLWLNQEITSDYFLEQLDLLENSLDINLKEELYYQKSIYNLYRGAVYYLNDDEKSSIKYLELSILNAENAIKINKVSDYYRVLSESGSYLMLQKGLRYIIKNSKAVNTNAEIALELDPNNIKAEMIIANGLINAPAIFGGNFKEGVKVFQRLINSERITNEEKFNALLSLGGATEERSYILDALKIYPNNKRAKEKLDSL